MRLKSGGRVPRPDVLIVARGGGSLEDLWGFNEEIVVRAAAESQIPLISAVGHETDWTLIDLVADARAPTPTKAAEWAVPMYSDLVEQLDTLGRRQRSSVRRYLTETRTHLKAAARGLPTLQELVALPRQRFDGAAGRLTQSVRGYLQRHTTRYVQVSGRLHPRALAFQIGLARRRLEQAERGNRDSLLRITSVARNRLERTTGRLQPGTVLRRLDVLSGSLDNLSRRASTAFEHRVTVRRRLLDSHGNMLKALSYQGVLARGYALVRDAEGHMVRSAAPLQPGADISIEFSDGRVAAEVKSGVRLPSGPGPADPGVKRPRPKPAPGGRGGQGSLF